MTSESPINSLPSKRVHRSILFADICDSSRLYRELGDTGARQVIQEALAIARDAVERAGGRVVDNIGDEVFCVLPDAGAALSAAIAIGSMVQAERERGQLPPGLAFRIGFAQGPVELNGDQVYGDTVYLAKRVSTESKYEQILLPLETLDGLEKPNRDEFRSLGQIHLKGRIEDVSLVEALWGTDLTVVVSRAPQAANTQATRELVLAYGERSVVISKALPSATLGRGGNCQLLIDDKCVSRQHAKVEYVEGAFIWTDQSRNGSVIQVAGRPPRNAFRDKTRLESSGTIQLGPSENAPSLLFAVREQAL